MPNNDQSRPFDVLAHREDVIDFIQSEEFGLILSKSTRQTVEHLLVRMGFRIEGAGSVNDLQEDMAFLRRFRKEYPELEKMLDAFKTEMLKLQLQQTNHESSCNTRMSAILVNQASAEKDRSDIKRDIRIAIIAFIATCVSIIGYFCVNYIFVSIHP